jgi:hypothetical protein
VCALAVCFGAEGKYEVLNLSSFGDFGERGLCVGRLEIWFDILLMDERVFPNREAEAGLAGVYGSNELVVEDVEDELNDREGMAGGEE